MRQQCGKRCNLITKVFSFPVGRALMQNSRLLVQFRKHDAIVFHDEIAFEGRDHRL